MKRISTILIAILIVTSAGAQNITLSPTVISSAGDYSEGDNISLSWTLGELAVTTLEGSNMMLTQGFQQGDDYVNSILQDPIKWQIIAYPNPVVEALRIQFDVLDPTDFLIEIQDVAGRLISQEEYDQVFPGDVLQFDMSDFKSGAYFYRISTTNREQVRVISIRKL